MQLKPSQKTQVHARVRACLDGLQTPLGRSLPTPPVSFDLSGRAAGQYRNLGSGRAHQLRFNAEIFAHNFEACLATTVPHEVAHYVVALCYPRRRVRPHGPKWRRLMALLGASPRVTHDFDLAPVRVRRQRRWLYHCGCRDHRLSSVRHNRVQQGRQEYRCAACRGALDFVGPAPDAA
ncbi:MAG: SprT-like domain-containing protein [Pseudomonadota bacterium]